MCQKLELMKQIHLFKKGFVIFLKGATFSDFIDARLLKPHTLKHQNPLSAIMADLIFIRFKPLQVVQN